MCSDHFDQNTELNLTEYMMNIDHLHRSSSELNDICSKNVTSLWEGSNVLKYF